MDIQDINNALLFLYADYNEPKTIILQCNKAKDIPYVKRALFQTLGDPSKIMTHDLYYGNKVIKIVTMSAGEDKVKGFNGDVYYIAYKDNSDWNEHCANEGIKQKLVPYEMWPWLNEADIYTLLVRDGMSGNEALHKMACDGLV